MDITWLLVVPILIVLFTSISTIGALHSIRNASEQALATLESQTARQNTDNSSR